MREQTGRGNVSINGAEFAVDLQAILWIPPFLLILLQFSGIVALLNSTLQTPGPAADLPTSHTNRPVSALCHTGISF